MQDQEEDSMISKATLQPVHHRYEKEGTFHTFGVLDLKSMANFLVSLKELFPYPHSHGVIEDNLDSIRKGDTPRFSMSKGMKSVSVKCNLLPGARSSFQISFTGLRPEELEFVSEMLDNHLGKEVRSSDGESFHAWFKKNALVMDPEAFVKNAKKS